MLIGQSNGYMMGPPGNRNLKRTHSLFIDDLKLYQQNHWKLKIVNKTIVKTRQDTGESYEVKKCAEISFNREQTPKLDCLNLLVERMKVLDPEQINNY